MSRDIRERLETFGAHATLDRIALNMDQVEQYNPPPNPAKTTDSRYFSYISDYGTESWELDALDPRVLTELINEHVATVTDEAKRNIRLNQQEVGREKLREVAERLEMESEE